MVRFRFSIAQLSAVVLVAGFIFAAAHSPTEPWANGAFSLALLVLGLALLGALFRRGPGRAYWRGFALLGWGYMMVAFGPWCDSHIAPLLITKTIGEWLHGSFRTTLVGQGIEPFERRIPDSDLSMFGYQQIGHALSAMLAGLLGGAVARRFAAGVERGPSRDRNEG
jgi:hypothetical protein